MSGVKALFQGYQLEQKGLVQINIVETTQRMPDIRFHETNLYSSHDTHQQPNTTMIQDVSNFFTFSFCPLRAESSLWLTKDGSMSHDLTINCCCQQHWRLHFLEGLLPLGAWRCSERRTRRWSCNAGRSGWPPGGSPGVAEAGEAWRVCWCPPPAVEAPLSTVSVGFPVAVDRKSIPQSAIP